MAWPYYVRLKFHDFNDNASTDDQGNDKKKYNYQCEFFNILCRPIGGPGRTFIRSQCGRTYKLRYTVDDPREAFEEATQLTLSDVAYMSVEDKRGLVECLTHDCKCECCVEFWFEDMNPAKEARCTGCGKMCILALDTVPLREALERSW